MCTLTHKHTCAYGQHLHIYMACGHNTHLKELAVKCMFVYVYTLSTNSIIQPQTEL